MSENIFDRTEMLLGQKAMEKLAASRVAVFGVGGVGGFAVEALVRSGIGAIDLIDHDRVSESNLNRQIIATRKTLGQHKVDAAAERIADINPDCRVTVHREFYLPETRGRFDFRDYDYVVDAIDTVAGKLALIEAARDAGTPIICSMGAGNKLDPAAFQVADIYETSVCPLAKVIRRECRKRGIKALKVVYSTEEPLRPVRGEGCDGPAAQDMDCDGPPAKRPPGSVAFAPSVAGLIAAGEVVRDLASVEKARVR
ncbi:MAG: tRNA threonylcarbamoyladenosine dehydratase [Firmicutes bacterium]|nr:tRNA threonylcarbamoyladenosine dehydratase [Bacillota bacterium]